MMRFFRVGDDNPLTGWHMLAITLLFFGTIIGVNVAMAFYAVSTFPGLQAKNSYVASQTYNHLLDDARAQADRGWKASVSAADGRVELVLKDAEGRPVRGLDVSAIAGRPVSAEEDRAITLDPSAAGYRAAEPLQSGRWLLEISALRRGELVWRETRPVVVPYKASAS